MTPAFSIIGGTLYGNRGAELMLSVAIGRLRDRFPEACCNIFSYMPKDDRCECLDNNISIYSATPLSLVTLLFPAAALFGLFRKMFGRRVLRLAPAPIRALGQSEVLYDIAGVSFIDGREKFLPFNALTLWPAMLLGIPVIKFSQAIGPIRSPVNRLFARMTLPYCQKIWARGAVSRKHLENSGLPGLDLDTADDLAFLYEDRYCLSRGTPKAVENVRLWRKSINDTASFRGIVGICPSAVLGSRTAPGGSQYECLIIELVNKLIGDGFAVFLYPNATRARAGERERNNDLPLIRRVVGGILNTEPNNRYFHYVNDDVNANDIAEIISMAEILLVSRFHAMVSALTQYQSVIILGWGHKYLEVMERFGLQKFVTDHKQATVESLLEQVREAYDNRTRIQEAIANGLGDVLASSARQLESIPQRKNH